MDFTQDDIDSLAEKLAGLSEGERHAFAAMFNDADDDVAGFARDGRSFAPITAVFETERWQGVSDRLPKSMWVTDWSM